MGRRGVQKLRQLHRGRGRGREFDLFLLAGFRVSIVVPAITRGGLHLAQRLVCDFHREKDEKREARDERENVQDRRAFVVFRAAHVPDLGITAGNRSRGLEGLFLFFTHCRKYRGHPKGKSD